MLSKKAHPSLGVTGSRGPVIAKISPMTKRYEKPFKTRQEWESEMLECLEHARKQIAAAHGAERVRALAHYHSILKQFNGLVLEGKIPPEEPCYT